jgi:hypothetical protein
LALRRDAPDARGEVRQPRILQLERRVGVPRDLARYALRPEFELLKEQQTL